MSGIARKTVKLSDAGAFILGGMSKEEAKRLLLEEKTKRKGSKK